MKSISFIIGIILGVVFLAASPGQGQWLSGGPYGGSVTGLAMSAANPDLIYAGSENGIYKSMDGGANWAPTGFNNTPVKVVRVDPANQDVVYAGTLENGLIKSADGGQTWTQQTALPLAEVRALAVDSGDSEIIYAGGRNKSGSTAIYKSVDAGNTWQASLIGGMTAVHALLVDTNDSATVYAGVADEDEAAGPDLRKSTDGGETWISRHVSPADKFIFGDDVAALAMTPAGGAPAVLYAIVTGDDVYKSEDQGESWQATNTNGFSVSVSDTMGLAVDPLSPATVYAGTSRSGLIYKSTNAGGSWAEKAIGLPGGEPTALVIDPRNGHVFVGLYEGGVYKSTDGAENWFFSSHGKNDTTILDLAVYPSDSSMILVAVSGAGHRVARTVDAGGAWTYLPTSPADRLAVAVDPQTPSTIYAGGLTGGLGDLFRSLDGGATWSQTGPHVQVNDILINPNNSDNILLASTRRITDQFTNFLWGVYTTFDSWDNSTHTIDTRPCSTLASGFNNDLYVGTIKVEDLNLSGAVFQSFDGGALDSWRRFSPGGVWVNEVRDIAVDLNSDLYAATDSGLYKTADGGATWPKLSGLPSDNIKAVAIDRSVSPARIYAGLAGHGVYVSKDGGATWSSLNDGLGNLNITRLAVSETEPPRLYAGTSFGGVWSLPIKIFKGDIDNNKVVDLTDAILALQVIINLQPSLPLTADGDVDGDRRVGIEEVVYVLQKLAELR